MLFCFLSRFGEVFQVWARQEDSIEVLYVNVPEFRVYSVKDSGLGPCMGPAVGLRFVHIFSYSVTLTAALTIQALYHNIYTSMHPFIGLSSCSCPGAQNLMNRRP